MTKTTIEYMPLNNALDADAALVIAVRDLVANLSPWRKSLGCRATAALFRRLASTFVALAAYAEIHVD